VKGIIRLDAMAPIHTTITHTVDTNTERMHRKNRDLWTEIEYLIHTRLATEAWPYLSARDLHGQLIELQDELQAYKQATTQEKKALHCPHIHIAGIKICWVKGHNDKVAKTDYVAQANRHSDEIAGQIAELTQVNVRRRIQIINLIIWKAPQE
jgi:hypothetical protein